MTKFDFFFEDIPDAVYSWTILNSTTLSKNAKVENDILLLKPFTKKVAGIYNCQAVNAKLNMIASKRININAAADKKAIHDVSDKIKILVESPKNQLKKGGQIRLRCSIGI